MRSAPRLVAALFALSLLGMAAGCATNDLRSRPGTTTTVIVTRHADRDGESDELNETGRERARALLAEVRDLGVTAIFSPNAGRNLATVQPLAGHLGIEITRTPQVSLFVAGSIAREILDRHAGGVVVWVGNVSGNLQAMYHLLGGTGPGPVEYGDLHILTIPDRGPVIVVKKRYGP